MAFTLKKNTTTTKAAELPDPQSFDPKNDADLVERKREGERLAALAHKVEDEYASTGDTLVTSARGAHLNAVARVQEGIGDPREVERLRRVREDEEDARDARRLRVQTAQAKAADASAAARQHHVEVAYPDALTRGRAALADDVRAIYALLLDVQRHIRHGQQVIRVLADAKLDAEQLGVVVSGLDGRLISLFTRATWGCGFIALAVEDRDSSAPDRGPLGTWRVTAKLVGIDLGDGGDEE